MKTMYIEQMGKVVWGCLLNTKIPTPPVTRQEDVDWWGIAPTGKVILHHHVEDDSIGITNCSLKPERLTKLTWSGGWIYFLTFSGKTFQLESRGILSPEEVAEAREYLADALMTLPN